MDAADAAAVRGPHKRLGQGGKAHGRGRNASFRGGRIRCLFLALASYSRVGTLLAVKPL